MAWHLLLHHNNYNNMDVQHKNSPGGSNIKVFCRFRPFNQKELQLKAEKIHRLGSKNQLIIKDPHKNQEASFMFDRIFDMQTHQEQVFEEVGRPVLNNILDGFNGTIMAYGQTSSGKTHTMQGYDINDRDQKGLIPRIIENLFMAIQKSPENLQFKLKTSIFEVYMEKIRDLLDVSKGDLKIRENKAGPYIQDLTEAYISDKVELYKLLQLGQKNRITCATNMNAHSSRSHLIFLLSLNQFNNQNSQSKTSKLYLIDLAGSEKVSKTGAEGRVLQQAKKINMSLASLGKVIKSLSQKIHHIPYRDSKLTRILKDSLGGNSKTTLIVTCSPHQIHVSETVSTLRFGENAQKIKNKPKINRELTIPELQKIIEDLEEKISEKDGWIKTLEEYITKQLNANLPKITLKIPSKDDNQVSNLKQTADLSSTLQISLKTSSFHEEQLLLDESVEDDQSFTIEEQKMKRMGHLTHSAEINHCIPIPQMVFESQVSGYDEQIASLQSQIQNYKQNLQAELHKFYQLKKQYNMLNENLKKVIEQNINYQEKQKKNEQSLAHLKSQLVNRYRQNCRLVLGQILNYSSECPNQEYHQNMNTIVEQKINKLLCLEDDQIKINSEGKILNIDCLDYWKKQKQQINKKMQQVIQKSMNLQKKLAIRENSMATSPPADPQNQRSQQFREIQQICNRRIIDLQQKLDFICDEYQKILAQQSNWKVQCHLYQLKLKHKDERIGELRDLLKEISEQMELMDHEYQDQMSVNTKIVKPIKGGFLFH